MVRRKQTKQRKRQGGGGGGRGGEKKCKAAFLKKQEIGGGTAGSSHKNWAVCVCVWVWGGEGETVWERRGARDRDRVRERRSLKGKLIWVLWMKKEDSRWLGSPPLPSPLLPYLTYSSIVRQILLLHSFTKTPSASFVSRSLPLSLPSPHHFLLFTEGKKLRGLSLCPLPFFFYSNSFFFFSNLFFAKRMQNRVREKGIMGVWDLVVHYKRG